MGTIMNAVFPVAVLCLGLGFAAGWLVKPDSAAPGAFPQADAKSSSTPVRGSMAAGPSPATEEKSKPWQAKGEKDPSKSTGLAQGSEAKEHSETVAEAGQQSHLKHLRDIHRRRFEARLQKLIAPLGLTDEQQARLRADLEARLAGLDKLSPTAIQDGDYMARLTSILDPSALDQDVEKLLEGDQPQKFQAMKTRETESKIESRAFKSMSNLSRVLTLEENQRSAVFAVLEQEARRAESETKQASMMGIHEVFMQDMGMESNDELGLSELMMQEMQAMTTAPDLTEPGAAMTKITSRLRSAAEKRIEEKVNLLAPVLNADQLSQYQTHLENTAANLLRMMGGSEEQP
jgi:hypothetical protein